MEKKKEEIFEEDAIRHGKEGTRNPWRREEKQFCPKDAGFEAILIGIDKFLTIGLTKISSPNHN